MGVPLFFNLENVTFLTDDNGRKVTASLPSEQITADLNAVASCPGERQIAVCGFCRGGGESSRFTTNNNQAPQNSGCCCLSDYII
jgi:dienelactone hydrolase